MKQPYPMPAKKMMKHLFLPFAMMAAFILAACSVSVAPRAAGIWSTQVSATAGVALVRTEGGKEVLRIACRRNPADVWIGTTLLPDGPGALRLQIGQTVLELVPESGEQGLSATGAPSAAFSQALGSGQPIYLHRANGPGVAVEPPARAAAEAFAAGCEHAAA